MLEINYQFYLKEPNQCMLPIPTKLMDQDMAVTTLLEIDSKEQQDLNIWEQKKANRVENKVRRYSFYKPHPNKPNTHSKIHGQVIDHLTNSHQNHHQTPIKPKQSSTLNPQQQSTINKLMSKSTAFNELQYWQSKMNWMSQSQKKQHSSQPKLMKKLSFGNQCSNRKSYRHVNRYADDHKAKHQQYKTNLIYSLLANKDILQHKAQPNQLNFNEKSTSNYSKNQNNAKKVSSQHIKLDPPHNLNLNNQMQNYMRETLKKIYLKNRNNQYSSSQPKHSQQERSSMIRQILINLQNIKDHQNICSQPNVKQNRQSNNQIDLVGDKGLQQIVTASRPQRLLYHQQQQRHIVNLNLEAQKIYKSRSINQPGVKKTLIKMQ